MEITSKSLLDTAKFAQDFLVSLFKEKRSKATVVALYGDLGSGKTTFTQFLAKELGIDNYVTSPTFVIEKKYRVPPPFQGGEAGSRGGLVLFKQLIHLDCYRLNTAEEILHLDWNEIINDSGNLIVVEWPERIKEVLPENTIKLEFEFVSENERKIEIKS